jgi:hypothetical protein
MTLQSGIDTVCEVVLVHELVVVEVCAVGCEEEDASEEEFVVDAVALMAVSMTLRAM